MFRFLFKLIILHAYFFNFSRCSDLNHLLLQTFEKPVKFSEYTLSDDTANNFKVLTRDFQADPYYEPKLCTEIVREWIGEVFPEDLTKEIVGMHKQNGTDVLMIHNFPVDDFIPETPRDGCRTTLKGNISEYALLGLCGLLGAYPVFDEAEKDGLPISQIIPVNNTRDIVSASSMGSKVKFLPHTENVYQNPPLKFFELLALRGDPKVSTTVIPFSSIMSYIKINYGIATYNWIIEQLQLNQYVMFTGPSFKDKVIEVALPIISFQNDEMVFRLNLNDNRTIGKNEEAKKVIDLFREVTSNLKFLESLATKFVLKKGDLLLFNNWRVMHSRDAFDIDESNWRWLQRIYCQC